MPNPHGFMWVSSDVHLVGPDGSSLDGHFTFVGDHGYLTLDHGTGQLAGVHAQGMIGVLSWEQAIYSLSGSYFVTP